MFLSYSFPVRFLSHLVFLLVYDVLVLLLSTLSFLEAFRTAATSLFSSVSGLNKGSGERKRGIILVG